MDVKTAGRTLEIFETFAQAQEPLSLTELGRALNAPLSSCLYLVRALEQRGYLYPVGTRRHLYPTRKLYDLARAIAQGESWIDRLEPMLLDLRDGTRETVLLGKRQGNKVVYLAVYEGPQTIRYSSQVGELKPLHSSSIGKALLAALNPAERKKLIPKLALDRFTETTLVDRETLTADIEAIATRGYSQTNGETVPDVMAIAKTVSLSKDIYGIAVAGPIYRMTENIDAHIAKLIDICAAVENSQ